MNKSSGNRTLEQPRDRMGRFESKNQARSGSASGKHKNPDIKAAPKSKGDM